jgi:hypothetical protein
MKNTAITSETKSYNSTNTSYLTKYNFDGERSNPHSPWTAAQITILDIRGCQTSGFLDMGIFSADRTALAHVALTLNRMIHCIFQMALLQERFRVEI